MDPIKVGNFIASLRKEKNITQEELAERINVSSKTVSKWEVGVNVPDTNCLYKLSKEFNVPTQDILNGGEIKNESENNDSIKNGINFYNRLFKRKVTKIVVLVIIGIISLFSILYTISNYNRVQVYDITSNDENFNVSGYIVYNSNESIFFIDGIEFLSSEIGTNLDNKYTFCEYYIKNDNNNKIYYKSRMDFSLSYYQSTQKTLESIKVSFVIDNSNDKIDISELDKFIMVLHLYEENGNMLEYNVKLNMEKHFSNTKIVY